MTSMSNKEHVTITELAKIMNLSRVQVFRKIKSGEIPAKKVGSIYIIPAEYASLYTGEMTERDEKLIARGVEKVVVQYGEVLKKLADT